MAFLFTASKTVIKQIGLPLRGRPILFITRMITDRIGLHSVLLPLLTDLVASDMLSHLVFFFLFFFLSFLLAHDEKLGW